VCDGWLACSVGCVSMLNVDKAAAAASVREVSARNAGGLCVQKEGKKAQAASEPTERYVT